MQIWTAEEAAKATGGKLHGSSDWAAFSISIDSRFTRKGDLFIALRGTKSDGHDYIREAFLKGASAVMAERLPNNFPESSPVLLVDDCITALRKLAEYRRAESEAKIIAVTGSVGKTSTKEMLNVAFSSLGITHVSAGNNNNEIGVPLSIAKMPKDTEFGIFEVGMNHAGEISPLSKLLKPHLAIITTIAEVHMEFFHNLEGIADAKAEIFDGLEKDAFAVINRDTEFFDKLSKIARKKGVKEIISFGEDFTSDIRLVDHNSSSSGSAVHCKAGFDEFSYNISARGKHVAINSLAVLAAVKALGHNLHDAAESLSSFTSQKGRGQILHSDINGGKITIIDESYNASPVAVRAALSNLGDIECQGRRIAVIGDMLELGEKSQAMHESLAPDILHNGIDVVFTVGEMSKHLLRKLPDAKKGESFSTSSEAMNALERFLKAGDVILIKASNGIGLGKLVEELARSKADAL